MRLQKSAVIETQSYRMIEMTFADQPNLDDAYEFLTFRTPVGKSGHPRLPEIQLEALGRLRSVIDEEIRRLDYTLSQDHGAGHAGG
jgi:hypothetical protein